MKITNAIKLTSLLALTAHSISYGMEKACIAPISNQSTSANESQEQLPFLPQEIVAFEIARYLDEKNYDNLKLVSTYFKNNLKGQGRTLTFVHLTKDCDPNGNAEGVEELFLEKMTDRLTQNPYAWGVDLTLRDPKSRYPEYRLNDDELIQLIPTFQTMPNLKSFDFTWSDVGDHGIKALIQAIPQVTSLQLRWAFFANQGLSHLKNSTDLRVLNHLKGIYSPPLAAHS